MFTGHVRMGFSTSLTWIGGGIPKMSIIVHSNPTSVSTFWLVEKQALEHRRSEVRRRLSDFFCESSVLDMWRLERKLDRAIDYDLIFLRPGEKA